MNHQGSLGVYEEVTVKHPRSTLRYLLNGIHELRGVAVQEALEELRDFELDYTGVVKPRPRKPSIK